MTDFFLDHLRRESDRFLAVLAEADPRARVPSCPDWDAADLLWHLADVQWFWASVVEDGLTSEEVEHPARPDSSDELMAFARAQADRLHRVLAESAPEDEAWTWSDDHTVGFIRRRQAHEALIHRLDAELVTGTVTPLDPDLAADGVLECLGVMYGGQPPWGSFAGDGRRALVELTDRPDASVTVELGLFSGTDPESGKSYADEQDISVVPADPAPVLWPRSVARPTTSTRGSGTAAVTRRSASRATTARPGRCGRSSATRSTRRSGAGSPVRRGRPRACPA